MLNISELTNCSVKSLRHVPRWNAWHHIDPEIKNAYERPLPIYIYTSYNSQTFIMSNPHLSKMHSGSFLIPYLRTLHKTRQALA